MDDEDIFAEGRSPYFDECRERIKNGTATDLDIEEFYMRLMQRFCVNVYEEKPVEPFILYAFADAFTKMLMGGHWNDEIPLPWTPRTPIRSRVEERDLTIYCEIENNIRAALKEDPSKKLKITKLLETAAFNHHCSYEIARDGYYKLKKKLS